MISLVKKYKIVSNNPYNDNPLNYKGLFIKDNWRDQYIDVIKKNNIKALFLNCSWGWNCNDYSFFQKIPKLKEIDIIDSESDSIKSIEHQNELEILGLNIPDSYFIDFSQLPQLRELFVYGRKNNLTLYQCISLEKLYIDEFKLGDKHSLNQLHNLRELTIANSNVTSLKFLEDLKKIEKLELYNCRKILSFSYIEGLENLKRLHISGYKNINDISFICSLKNLEILLIDAGIVDSLEPIAHLPNLKALAIVGNNSIIKDRNIEPIKSLNKLSILNINNHKSYNYKINNYWNWNDYGKARNNWVTPQNR